MTSKFPTAPGFQSGNENAENPPAYPEHPIPAYGPPPNQVHPQYGMMPPGQPIGSQFAGQPNWPQQGGIVGQPPYGAPPGYGVPPQPYAPIMTQPTQQQMQWMPLPTQQIPNCPPGLEYLASIDQLLVKQQIQIIELLTGYEAANKYLIYNSLGQSLYYAVEDSESITRQCFGSLRLFDMKILDNAGNEIIHIFRPFRCTGCCYPGFLQQLEVTAPVGTVVGYVTQLWSLSKQYFQIENANREPVLKIVGPYCTFSCGGDVVFKVLSNDESTEVGSIRKQWTGLLRESYTDADNFGITFPEDLDVKMKAVMLGACFLIDFMFYETRSQRQSHRRHY